MVDLGSVRGMNGVQGPPDASGELFPAAAVDNLVGHVVRYVVLQALVCWMLRRVCCWWCLLLPV